MAFPKDFFWGISTASYQIEGAHDEDGKGPSVWDAFCHAPGNVVSGHTGDVAIDHYHRYKDDIALMKDFGIQVYRFSVSWPRVLPEGIGAANEKGLEFYDKLIDALLEVNIIPHLMMYHWDYPLALFRRGGWSNPDSSSWFAEYAALLADRYSDRVAHWYTLEEIVCPIGLGLYEGRHAPGIHLPLGEVLQAGHHALLGHGKAVQALRAHGKQELTIGIVPAGKIYIPADEGNPTDLEAAQNATFSIKDTQNLGNHSWWLDPVYLGHYPEDGLSLYGADAPHAKEGDMELIKQPIDVCAFNYYSTSRVTTAKDGQPLVLPYPPGYPMTTQGGWAIIPEGMYYGLKFFHERYGLPMVITENGHQNNDYVMLDGRVHDQERIDYTLRNLLQVERAIDDGIPVEGYLHWTIIDNFEWAFGYQVRVGLVHVDYETQVRTPKDSAYWYRDVIDTNGKHIHEMKYFYE
jgi:beta-glucosidase